MCEERAASSENEPIHDRVTLADQDQLSWMDPTRTSRDWTWGTTGPGVVIGRRKDRKILSGCTLWYTTQNVENNIEKKQKLCAKSHALARHVSDGPVGIYVLNTYTKE